MITSLKNRTKSEIVEQERLAEAVARRNFIESVPMGFAQEGAGSDRFKKFLVTSSKLSATAKYSVHIGATILQLSKLTVLKFDRFLAKYLRPQSYEMLYIETDGLACAFSARDGMDGCVKAGLEQEYGLVKERAIIGQRIGMWEASRRAVSFCSTGLKAHSELYEDGGEHIVMKSLSKSHAANLALLNHDHMRQRVLDREGPMKCAAHSLRTLAGSMCLYTGKKNAFTMVNIKRYELPWPYHAYIPYAYLACDDDDGSSKTIEEIFPQIQNFRIEKEQPSIGERLERFFGRETLLQRLLQVSSSPRARARVCVCVSANFVRCFRVKLWSDYGVLWRPTPPPPPH